MKKLIAVLLCFVILMLSGCGDSGTAVTEAVTEGTAAVTTEEETTEFVYVSGAPDCDFEGAVFRVSTADPALYTILLDFDFEAEDGDVIHDAIYKRNRKIEEKYNIVFTNEYREWPQGTELMKKTAMSGDDAYDLIMVINRDAFAAALDGYILNVADIPYLDIEAPWYCHELNKQFTLNNQMFLAYTDECMNMYAQTLAVMFNKTLAENLALPDMYTMAREGRWTLDAFIENARAAVSDLNGDGKFSVTDDVLGIGTEFDMFIPSMWIGSELKTIHKNADDIPEYTAAGDDKLISVLDKVAGWYNEDGLVDDSWDYTNFSGDAARDASVAYFGEGHYIYRVGCTTNIMQLRSMEADFGLLPLPKYDEAQEKYVSRMIDGWIHVPPVTVTRLELVGTIMEALGAESKNLVMPAFFDVALTHKLTRDNDSSEMLDIIFESITVDLGDTVWQGDVRNAVVHSVYQGKTGVYASALEKVTKKINKIIEKAVEKAIASE
ncbi:MAG: hypothetical protein ACOX4O_04480 [Eubacteriales bacterium]